MKPSRVLTVLCLLASLVAWIGAASQGSGAAVGRRDTSPPSVPTNLTVAAISAAGVSLSWSRSTDNVGVAGYDVYNGQKRVATTPTTSYALKGLRCGTSYKLAVDAYDVAGNHSGLASVTVATASCADTQAPTVPSGLLISGSSQTSVSFSWSASVDNIGVVGYGVYLNGAKLATSTQTMYTISSLSCGTSYSLAVDAYDAAGNRSSLAGLTTSTAACPDTTAPTVPANLSLTGTSQTSMSLFWSTSLDDTGVTGYDVYLNGARLATTPGASYTVSSLSCAQSYTLAVDAYDAAGNVSGQATLIAPTTVCSAPAVRIDAGAASSTSTTGQTFVADMHFSGGTAASTSASIAGTTDGTLYQSERWGSFSYAVPVPNGTYDVRLHFVELYYQAPCSGKRVFGIDILDTPASPDLANIDICAAVGPDTALVRTIAGVAVSDGTLNLQSVYGSADDPEIAAIEVIPTGTTATAPPPASDTQPPSTPSALTATAVNQTTVSLSWNAATDNVGVIGYDIYRDQTKAGTVTTTSASFSGLSCGTSASFAVGAYDAAGNRSPLSAITASTSACSPAPTGSMLSFAPPTLTNPITINISSPTGDLNLDPTKDYILKMPSSPVKPGPDGGIWVDGGHNIVLIGGEFDFTGVVNSCCTEKEGRVATFMNTTGTIHIEGLWAHGDGLVEGVQMFAPKATLQLENCRFDHLHTTSYALHSDLIQADDALDIRVDHFTGSSEVQGFSRFNTEAGNVATFKNANIIGLPGSSDSSPRLLWQNSSWLPMVLTNLYVQPRAGQSLGIALWPGSDGFPQATQNADGFPQATQNADGSYTWPSSSAISGVVSAGTPAAGDFVPLGVAGTSYQSPGYQQTQP